MPRAASRAARMYAICALAAVLAAFVVILASSLVRHLQAGAACAPWPACYGQPASAEAAARTPLLAAARSTHRTAASAVLLLVVAMAYLAWRARTLDRELRFALAALAVVLGLAAFGALTTGSRVPAVIMTNLSGGFLLLALLACALPRPDADAFGDTPRVLFVLVLVLAAAQVGIGALIGANRLLTTCAAPGSCPQALPEALTSPLWNVLQPLSDVASATPDRPGAVLLHWMHRHLAMAVFLGVVLLGATRRPGTGVHGPLLIATVVVAPLLGFLAVRLAAPLGIVVLHDAMAALLLALLARGLVQSARSLSLTRAA